LPLAPVDTPMSKNEMAPTTLLTPYRRCNGYRFIGMLLHAPARSRSLQEVQLNYVAAAARARHRSRPQIGAFTSEIELAAIKPIRKLFHPDAMKEFPFALRPERCEPTRDRGDARPQSANECVDRIHAAATSSLSSGIDSNGRTSPLPICAKKLPDGGPSRSLKWALEMKLVLTTAESALSSYR
jgi:hypothetical protein